MIRLFLGRARQILWIDWPWIPSAFTVGSLLTGLIIIQKQFFPDLQISVPSGYAERILAITMVLLVYFFITSIFIFSRLRIERQFRGHEHSFRYDRKGTLFNEGEPNIAIRVTTFKLLLDAFRQKMVEAEYYDTLVDAGRTTPLEFALNIGEIYNRDVSKKAGKKKWEDLSIQEKIDEWHEYDNYTGWGVMVGTVHEASVTITVLHVGGLFDGKGGKLFSFFLAGYCETILSHMLKGHEIGKYADYESVKLVEPFVNADRSVQLEYKFH